MSVLNIIKYPDSLLKQVAKPVTKFDANLHKLLDDMRDTMYFANGIGLAAPQIASLQRIAVIDVSEDRNDVIEIINPEITLTGTRIPSEEGCLSIPGYRESITRNSSLTLKAQNRNGDFFEINTDGLLAICIQHEIDHLNGILFIDHISRLKHQFFKSWFQKNEPL